MNHPVFSVRHVAGHHPLRAGGCWGQRPRSKISRLPGHTVLEQNGYPVLTARDGAVATGLLLRLDAPELARLDLYESLFGYTRQALADGQGGHVWVYLPEHAQISPDAAPWVLSDWVARMGEAATLASAEIMLLARSHDRDALAVR